MTTAVGNEMLVARVDAFDQPIGTILRKDVFREHANFRTAHVFLFNSAGELLLQKLATNRERHPGYWGSSVASYLFADEDYGEAAQRRLLQELGVRSPLRFFDKTSMDDEGCTKFVALFTTVRDGPVSIADQRHIESVEFVRTQDLLPMVTARERAFTPTFLMLLDVYFRRHHN